MNEITSRWWDYAECGESNLARRRITNPLIRKSDFDSSKLEDIERASQVCVECIGQIGCLLAAANELSRFDNFRGVRGGYIVSEVEKANRNGKFELLVAKATQQVVELMSISEEIKAQENYG